ncbi:MAG: hypothetical protein AVO35_11570 [Candidatus Aegiribacteria sp. MLS_C]|nr:MAG: hypothetical protein AVO35_11570 [Candidatus Aegiribacteria sp. MLS_C]
MTDQAVTGSGDLVLLGRAEKPHGLKGSVSVRMFVGHGRVGFREGTSLVLDGIGTVTVVRCTERGDSRYSLTFREVRSRQEAEEHRNASLFISRASMGELDFIPLYGFPGMTLESRGSVMKVLDAEPSGANPMLLVEHGEKVFHVPVILVMETGRVDWDGMRIEVELPEGLEDLPL